MLTGLYIDFSDDQGQLTPQSMQFEQIKAFMVSLVTCKTEEDPVKNEGPRVLTTILKL